MKTVADVASPGCADAITESFLFTVPAQADVFSAADLCAPSAMLDILTPFLRRHPGEDRAAVISMWSQWYFARLLPAWTRINLLHRWQLPSDPRHIRFTLEETGVPHQFILDHAGAGITAGADIFARFAPLTEGHLQPVCQTFSRLADMKPAMFWNNAAIRIDYGFTLVREQGGDTAAANVLLTGKTLPDGTVNRLYEPVRHVDNGEGAGPQVIRRLCCLRYKLGETEYCPSCPLLMADRRKSHRRA